MTQTSAPDVSRFDFVTSLIAADLSEEGAFCHFVHPETGEPLYLPGADLGDGKMDESKRVGAYVRAVNSKAFEAYTDELTRKALNRNKQAKTEAQKQDLAVRNVRRQTPDLFAGLVSRFYNTSMAAPGEWTPTLEQKLAIAADPYNRVNVERVLGFAGDAANYPASASELPGDAVGNDPAAD